jgi:hypothetical protein
MKRVITWADEFIGHRVYSATAGSNVGHNWRIADTSSSGTPTYAPVTPGRGVTLTHDNTNEVQNVCLFMDDKLNFDIDDIDRVRLRVKMGQAVMNAAASVAFGLGSARNDAIDSIAAAAIFRLIGASAAVLVESDDGVNDKDDIATGATLATTAKDFVISFANGKSDVRFFVDGQPVAMSTTFDMSNYSGGLQIFLQLQKTAATSTDSVTLEAVEVTLRGE